MTGAELRLNEAEKVVLGTVRHACRLGDPVSRREIAARLQGVYGLASITFALRALVELRLLSKPTCGYYLPTEEER